MLDVFKEYGTDSYIGLIASVKYVLYGNNLLYDECVLYDGKSNKDKIHFGRRFVCDLCRTYCQRYPCRNDVKTLQCRVETDIIMTEEKDGEYLCSYVMKSRTLSGVCSDQ